MDTDLERAREIAQGTVLAYPFLLGLEDRIGVALSGSRAVGYHVPSSDYDFLVLCDRDTYDEVARRAGASPEATSIDPALSSQESQQRFGVEVHLDIYEQARVEQGLAAYKDVLRWIWTHAQALHDPAQRVARLQASITAYPREVLERKLIRHWLTDFHLSVHGITYRYESQNVFSVVHTVGAKIAEFCRLCCLLDGRPFPYEKWLLRACKETTTGARLAPHLECALGHVTHLGDDLVESADRVRQAVYALDTEACDILEEALMAWGIERAWIENAYHSVSDVLFE
jgi:hypothetical protein